MTAFADLHKFSEDARLRLIGRTAAESTGRVAFLVDVVNGSHAKGDRYLQKLREWYPQLELKQRGDGPLPEMETIEIGPKVGHN